MTGHRLRSQDVPKLKCPACGEFESRIIRAQPDDVGECYERERRCRWCACIYTTEERVKVHSATSSDTPEHAQR
jgi:transcriptional regulator NrdR family protein